jgi:hypothetical protein
MSKRATGWNLLPIVAAGGRYTIAGVPADRQGLSARLLSVAGAGRRSAMTDGVTPQR